VPGYYYIEITSFLMTMLERCADSSEDVFGIKVKGKITAEDYEAVIPEIRAIVEKYGGVRLLIDLTDFKGETMNAWGPDFRFGKEFGKKIIRLAIVGDKLWEQWLAGLATPFWAKEAKYFPSSISNEAWGWLRGTL
jgi:hypothetical protein